MKKIVIEISDVQHDEMKKYLEKCFSSSIEEECCFADYTIKLNVSPFGNELSVEMYGKVDLGDVNWRMDTGF
jgi:hypothetical protein